MFTTPSFVVVFCYGGGQLFSKIEEYQVLRDGSSMVPAGTWYCIKNMYVVERRHTNDLCDDYDKN